MGIEGNDQNNAQDSLYDAFLPVQGGYDERTAMQAAYHLPEPTVTFFYGSRDKIAAFHRENFLHPTYPSFHIGMQLGTASHSKPFMDETPAQLNFEPGYNFLPVQVRYEGVHRAALLDAFADVPYEFFGKEKPKPLPVRKNFGGIPGRNNNF